MKSIAKDILRSAGGAYWRLRASPPVWNLLTRRSRRLYRAHPVRLSAVEERVANDLSRSGVGIAHMSEFFPRAVFEELEQRARARWQSPDVGRVVSERLAAARSGKKPEGIRKFFLVDLWSGPPTLDLGHPFIRFSLSDPVLHVVNAYLGRWSKFRFWHLEATLPVAGNVPATASQRWHRDPEDRRLVKVFLYLNDVDEGAGPFTYLEGSQDGGRWRGLFPIAPPRGSRSMPADEDRFIPRQDIRAFQGPAGALIFCDTTGLHRGGLATLRPRLMYTSVYTSAASPWPIRYAYPPNFDPSGLSRAARFAVDNDPNQKEPRYY